MTSELRPEYLATRLRYEPETGKLFWLNCETMPPNWNGRFAGKEAFTARRPSGYLHGAINSTLYQAHRIAWAIYYGEWPVSAIDHIDHDKTNNKISNLRLASDSVNNKNKSKQHNNKSGVTGVSWFKDCSKWRAEIKVDGRKKHLGLFSKFEDAVAVRKAAEEQYGFHENHGI